MPTNLTLKIGRNKYQVESLAAAQKFYDGMRDQLYASGADSPIMPSATIQDDAGKTIAKVSHNGRLWDLAGKPLEVLAIAQEAR